MDLHVTLNFDDGETMIEFPQDSTTIGALVTEIGPALYRLDSVPLMVDSASFRDIFEAERLDGGKLRFLRVVEKSNWRTYSWLLPQDVVEKLTTTALLDRVTEQGGHWERVFGGVLFICLPSEVEWDPSPEIMELAG